MGKTQGVDYPEDLQNDVCDAVMLTLIDLAHVRGGNHRSSAQVRNTVTNMRETWVLILQMTGLEPLDVPTEGEVSSG